MRTALLVCALAACSGSTTTNQSDASPPDSTSPDVAPFDSNPSDTIPSLDVANGDIALPSDGSRDATAEAATDAGCPMALDREYRIGREGGKVAFTDVITLSPAARFVLRRLRGDTMSAMCETEIPPCGAAEMVHIGTVVRALSDPEVSALLDQRSALVGYDSRPADGSVFVIRRGADTLLVGGSCRETPGTACVPVPVGVQRAVDILSALIDQERQRPVCRSALGA